MDEEISATIAALVASDEPARHLTGLKLAVSLEVPLWGTWKGLLPDMQYEDPMRRFWRERSAENAARYAEAIIAAAMDYPQMRHLALISNLITVEQALDMPGGLLPLLQVQPMEIFDLIYGSHLIAGVWNLTTGYAATGYYTIDYLSGIINDFTAVGHYLNDRPHPP